MQTKIKYVVEDVDRHGNVRLYFRRKGQPKARLRGPAGSPEFWEDYGKAVAGELKPRAPQSKMSVRRGSLRWLCIEYQSSATFRRLAPSTQRVRRRILDRLCEKYGDNPYAQLEARHIRQWRDLLSEKPEAANAVIKTLRQVFSFAIEYEHVDRNPTRDVAYIRTGSEGFHSWTLDEIKKFEDRHPIGTKARLTLALLLYTGQRRSDIVRLGRQHVRNGWLEFTQHKGRNLHPVTLAIPIVAELQRVIDASPTGDLTFLVTAFGKPFTADGFGNRFRKWCIEAGLSHCSAHGLRKAAAVMLAEHGCSPHEIMAITGHRTLKEIDRYTRGVRQRALAQSAVAKFSGQGENISVPLDSARRKSGTVMSPKALKNKKK